MGKIQEILKSHSMNISTSEWVKGVYEHIDPTNPHLKIDSKAQLKHECEKRGLIAKPFMKRKSQGKGSEWTI